MRKFIYVIWTAMLVFGIGGSGVADAKSRVFDTQTGKVKVEKVASGLDTPWAMAMLPDGRLVVTERDGQMYLVEPGIGGKKHKKTRIRGVPKIWTQGQGGLLDVVLDPGFATNRKLYFTYSAPRGGRAGTAIASARLNTESRPKLEAVKILFSMKKKTRSGAHFGSRIVPDGKGNLYFTIGDRGDPKRAQDPFDAAGSVLRIRTDGSIPPDNPFADGKKGLPQIWSMGHRNPQGATLNDRTSKVWTLSHGARGGDEINIPDAGKNYGWPVISYGTQYTGRKIGVGTERKGLEQPIYYWDPSIAPSGMDFYNGDLLPGWRGNLFVGALKFQMLSRLTVRDNGIVAEENLFQGEFGRVRDVRSFPDGALWFLTNDGEGSIYRVTAAD